MNLNWFRTYVYAKVTGAIKKNKLYSYSWKAKEQMFTECFQEQVYKNSAITQRGALNLFKVVL